MQTLTPEFQKQFGISKVIGSFNGGQKIVYIVEDTSGKKMAMKSFIYYTPRDIQEIDILRRLGALPGISKIVDVKDYQGKPLLFEEYIEAPDLEEIIPSYEGNIDKVRTFIIDSVDILSPIWKEKIVHRDLKPKNIKILSDGKPIILDFGIARDLTAQSLTDTGETQPMTWNYASPEQYNGDKDSIGYRTDFFCLGLIAYMLYYQRHPFGSTKAEIEGKFATSDNEIAL